MQYQKMVIATIPSEYYIRLRRTLLTESSIIFHVYIIKPKIGSSCRRFDTER